MTTASDFEEAGRFLGLSPQYIGFLIHRYQMGDARALQDLQVILEHANTLQGVLKQRNQKDESNES